MNIDSAMQQDGEFNDIERGWEVKNTLPEPIVLMRHLDRCLKLSGANLMQINCRSEFKCAIYGLEAALADYQDDEYVKDKNTISTGKISSPMEEIRKTMGLFSALKRLLRRSPITENPVKRVEAVEE